MPFDPDIHHRRSLRLSGYDYAQAGAYFITICTHERQCLFGKIGDGVVLVSEIGKIAIAEWFRTSEVRPSVALDAFVLMPNHLHGIIFLGASPEESRAQATRWVTRPNDARRSTVLPAGAASGSIGAIIAQYKSITTKHINRIRNTPGAQVWQRNYHDHIIRNDRALNRLRDYVAGNLSRWAEDTLHPDNPSDWESRLRK